MGPRNLLNPNAARARRIAGGDFAKLMFEIAAGDRVVVERMWVLVTARNASGYVGILDNDPTEVAENDELWSGTELPFAAANVIAIMERNESSLAMAELPPRRSWLLR